MTELNRQAMSGEYEHSNENAVPETDEAPAAQNTNPPGKVVEESPKDSPKSDD